MKRFLILTLALFHSAVDAQTLKWPTITTNGLHMAAEVYRDGTGELYVAGELDGATVALESALVDDPTIPEDPGDPDANLAWFPVSPCDSITAPGKCIYTVGESRLRLNVSGGGPSLEINAGTSRVKVAYQQPADGGSPAWTDNGSTLAFGYAPNDLVGPLITLESEEVRLQAIGAALSSGATPTLAQPHLRWPMPTASTSSYLWVEDTAAGTWAGINLKVGSGRWTFDRNGVFRSEAAIGMTNTRGLDVASFRTHTSFNVGVGGDGSGIGSLVATDSSLTWDASRVSVQDLLRLPVRSTPPASPLCGDVYFDSTLSFPCVYNCTGFVRLDDSAVTCP